MVSKTILIGNIGQEPETRFTASGAAITNISVATTERWKDKTTGDKMEKTEWHKVTFFAHLANSAAKYLYKGAKVYIEGKNVTNQWEKDGQKHYTTEVHVREYLLLSPMKDQPDDQQGASQRQQQSQPANQPAPDSNGSFDDDIPF